MNYTIDENERYVGVKEVIKFLNNMPLSTFYHYRKMGWIPKARYLGVTPLWRVKDLLNLFEKLPTTSMCSRYSPAGKKGNRPTPA